MRPERYLQRTRLAGNTGLSPQARKQNGPQQANKPKAKMATRRPPAGWVQAKFATQPGEGSA